MKKHWIGSVLLAVLLLTGCYPTTYVELTERESELANTLEASLWSAETVSGDTVEADVAVPTGIENSSSGGEGSRPNHTQSGSVQPPSESQPPTSEAAQPPEPMETSETDASMELQPTEGKTETLDTTTGSSADEVEVTTPPEPTETQPAEPSVYDIGSHTVGSIEYAIVQEINRQRSQAGLAALGMDGTICALGSIQAYEYTLGISPSVSILSDYGYGYGAADTHLQTFDAGFSSGDIAWMWVSFCDSGVYLSPDYTAVGVGTYTSNGVVYVSGIFMG
ncbi:MAG TPA: hypothetical protein IAC31_03815 [Candidatus Faecousia intestinigallinarum]|nr:hypothetical protein [Candidatus Faecousia intestinigallinarum]